ncbi:MAG: sulfite exporter TauE/SafE family protein [Gemmatimonadaceae bacterium]
MTLLATVLAFVIGITLGLLGGGGSILTVPVFVYVMGYDPKVAIAMSLPVVGGAALVGAVRHWHMGHVDLRMAVPFGAAAMIAAYAGARVARFVSGEVQLIVLAVVMAAAAISMFRRGAPTPSAAPAPGFRAGLLGIAATVGVLTGIVGVGGGFLIVPALVVLGGVSMSAAVGTSLLVISMNTLSGFLGYQGTVDIPWGVVVPFGALAAAGIFAGAALIRFVDQRTLKRAFAVLLLLIASLILWQSRSTFFA